ncbi:MAG: 30S ribosomal protein S12 methylthiotransferase RimO [bacterium]|nr:30S ribosomal protein S12 methylthiotransferase RimO [bacterium]
MRETTLDTENKSNPVRVGLIGLGCAKNRIDAEVMLGHLSSSGLEITNDSESADVVIVNTCGFILDAKTESVEAILEVAEAKRRGAVQRLLVAGCMTQAYANELMQEVPEIDAFVGLDELDEVVTAAVGDLGRPSTPDQRGAIRLYDAESPRLLSTDGYAYIKVAEGCNNPCTFCHIPAMRGQFRSRSEDDIVEEAKRLEKQGIQELVFIAQDTTRYGEDRGGETGLGQLLEAVIQQTDIPWIRFLYAYPATLGDDVIELMAREPRLLSYLDIPLQHVNRTVLKAMKRGGDGQSYRRLIERVREMVPDVVLRTTFIVGFPGENDHAFSELVEFVRDIRFDHVGVFSYSWQEENPGAALGDPVPEDEKKLRREKILELQQQISLDHNRSLIGSRFTALVEGALEEMPLLTKARLARHAPEIDGRVLINDGTARIGDLVEVEITEAHPYDVIGHIVGSVRASKRDLKQLPVQG